MPLQPNYTDFATVNSYIGGQLNAGTDTALVNTLIDAISREIDEYTNQVFGKSDSDETRTFYVVGEVVPLRPALYSLTSVSVGDSLMEVGSYYLDTTSMSPDGTPQPSSLLLLRPP